MPLPASPSFILLNILMGESLSFFSRVVYTHICTYIYIARF
jgi:hypothetical protein